MNRLEKFDFLMDIIDNWAEKTPDRYGSSFRNLREGAAIREIAVTPGHSVQLSQLKTFLATEILEIFPWDAASKITWKEIRRSLAEEGTKKYSFDFKELDNCFSPQANRDAAGKSQLLAPGIGLMEGLEGWEDIPLYLLGKLQDTFRKKLGEYWRMCAADFDFSTVRRRYARWKLRVPHSPEAEKYDEMDEDAGTDDFVSECDECELKLNQYMECLVALALHEIFVRKFSENRNMLMEELKQYNRKLDKVPDEMEKVLELYANADEEERKKLAKRSETLAQEAREDSRLFGKFILLYLLCLNHSISLGAEIQIAMLLEKKRLEEIKQRKNGSEYMLQQHLEFIKNRYLWCMEGYNRNKRDSYGQLERNVKNIFVNFIENIQWPERQAIKKAVEAYLKIVEQGHMDKEREEQLWYVQSIIARPLMEQAEEETEPA